MGTVEKAILETIGGAGYVVSVEADRVTAIDSATGEGNRVCRITKRFEDGGYRDQEERWTGIHDTMIEAMIRLVEALRSHVEELSIGS